MNTNAARIIEQKVDELYATASARHPTYETVVHREFCESMLHTFVDAESPTGLLAFQHARQKYGYLTPDEIAEDDLKNSDDGICSHGLDFWTCPRGCFG
ncbi:hypothetical protein [Stutzerimonas stutzeri]|uniref:CcgAII protein n=1 Tax=Stutzerimonas stutzeri TaxID=316 RepID=A0AA40RU34_STUST|nr:hypothetical protein [Stutzerimonas stutzeri]MBA1305879.1 hypothetical protein [Stutzerimonas stutzeri]